MTPSNPSNSQPLIYRIMDALGVSHLVACINHTHDQSEVDGLQSALLSKADATRTDARLNSKIDKVTNAINGNIAIFDMDEGIEDSGTKLSDLQTKLEFDNEPTANSTNPVTSGGVKLALDNITSIRVYNAQASAKPLIEDIFGDPTLAKVDVGIINQTGADASIADLFSLSSGQTLVLPDNAPSIPNGKMVVLHIYRLPTQGNFLIGVGNIYAIE